VDGGEPQHVGQQVLVQGTGKAGLAAHPHQPQAQAQLDQEVRGAGQGITPADTDQMLRAIG
jgi:hypothetical protein